MVGRPTGMCRRAASAGPWGLVRGAALALALASAAIPAGADTDTGQLTVTATVLSGCTLIGGSLDFGDYVSGQPGNRDAAGQISYVNCSGLLTFDLDGGQAGDVMARRMSSGDASLGYQIYRTSARSSVWGMGADALQLQLLGAAPMSGSVGVHGRIFGGQSVPAGSYTDIVNITLTFLD
jgi:spore coat protein U-like protein